jgi:hypothetical protein
LRFERSKRLKGLSGLKGFARRSLRWQVRLKRSSVERLCLTKLAVAGAVEAKLGRKALLMNRQLRLGMGLGILYNILWCYVIAGGSPG